MKYTIISCICLTIIVACNNNTTEVKTTAEQIPAPEKALKDAIAQYPDSALLQQTLIQYYQDNGVLDIALAETNKAIKKDTTDSRLWDKKAELYLLQDDTANAVRCFEKAIDIFPDPEYIMSLGWLYAQTKNENALVMADALLIGKNARADKEANLIKGLYFSALGDKQKAIVFFNNCLAIDYTYMQAYREKAIVLFDMSKYDEAIKILTKAITLQNNFDEGYYWLGKCYQKQNNTTAAIENYQKALFYNADFIEAKDALGKLGVK